MYISIVHLQTNCHHTYRYRCTVLHISYARRYNSLFSLIFLKNTILSFSWPFLQFLSFMFVLAWGYSFWKQLYWGVFGCNYTHLCGWRTSVCFDRSTPFSWPPQTRSKIPPSLPKISFSSPLNIYPLSQGNNGSNYSLLF